MMVKWLFRLCFHICVCLLLGKLCKTQQDRNPIELKDGAYTNVLIAIEKGVEEDPMIIQSIKDIFRSGSSVLFTATNRRVYFGEITILVPLTWSRKPEYQVARLEAYENANVVVTNQQLNHRPWVDNPFKCGSQGRFIHLSKTYITDEDTRNEFGVPGKVIARQFAKLRWGVFDEDYVPGTDDAEPYYQSNDIGGGLEGTRCSPEVHGVIQDDTGNLCEKDPFGNLPADCVFVPDSTGQTAKASLMFASHIHSIDIFCDDLRGEPGSHNYDAPNLQNLKCDYQSIWEVMRKSEDFRYENSPPLPEDTDISPNFTLVQPGGSLRMVLVLDTSGSMGGERFEKMILGAKNFIQSVTPNGSYVGIVEFNTHAYVMSYMVEIINEASRELLISRLPPDAGGATCIGCGLLEGIQVAQYNGMDSQGADLILLSDGVENQDPRIADTFDDIERSGVIVHTIAFSQADDQMEELAQMTGGISSTCADGGSAQCVISAFTAIITQRPQSVATSAPLQVQSSDITLSPYSIHTTDVLIDESLGRDTVMTFTWSENTMISITVTGPDGTIIDDTDSRYNPDGSSKLITVNIAEAQAGVWVIEISNAGNDHKEYVSVEVNSKPRSDDVYPPMVNSFLGTSFVNYTTTPLVEIYASVHVNYAPVYDATVTAEVDSASTGDVTIILLLDNGRGADLLAGDGIYSAYFLEFSSNGRYSFKVDVNGATTTSPNMAMRLKRDVATETPPSNSSSSLGFRRTSNAGVVQVVSYSPDLNIDILAPSKITDIASMERTYDENRNVTLTWSAVGDDLDQGTGAYYELRFSISFTQIRTNFTSSTAITDNDLLLGNLSRVASSGTLESITIRLPGNQSGDIYSFMIRAWDEAGNAGPLSNIVSVSRRPLPPTTIPTTISTIISTTISTTILTTMLSWTSKVPTDMTEIFPIWAIITLACVGCLLVLGIAVLIIVCCVDPWNRATTVKKVDDSKPNIDHDNKAYEPEYEEPNVLYVKEMRYIEGDWPGAPIPPPHDPQNIPK